MTDYMTAQNLAHDGEDMDSYWQDLYDMEQSEIEESKKEKPMTKLTNEQIEQMQNVVDFLLVEGDLDGVDFGEPHPSGKPFFWRKKLREAWGVQHEEILSLRQEVETLISLKELIISTVKDADVSEGDYYQAGEGLIKIAQELHRKEQSHE